ncbi:DUF6252 family protein [Hymenobacter rubidus]|uniref:DUF6252 family protein n=1 Tax=Hymenobacter rubidus TaxID=1441626 RepID=UPI00191EED23|nr:DUF6252 family protein [Hymenobacter rubidus]
MNKLVLHALLLAALLDLSQCKNNGADPADQLPPATQSGENTFGCLVNGQAWTPRGNDGFSNYSVSYDPVYHFGTLNVAAYRLSGNGADQQTIGFGSDSIQTTGSYFLKKGGRHQAGFVNRANGCQYYTVDVGTYGKGGFTITRLDRRAGIVSGTFWFTLYKPGCDSIRVTNGRFDRKL